jgi:hypothetical protein
LRHNDHSGKGAHVGRLPGTTPSPLRLNRIVHGVPGRQASLQKPECMSLLVVAAATVIGSEREQR